jgi:hypothetical protein
MIVCRSFAANATKNFVVKMKNEVAGVRAWT